MTDKQLINQYLANGGSIKYYPASEDKFEPANTLLPTGAPIQYDQFGNRIYQNLDKTPLSAIWDTSTLNYGD